jgi:hypothetical protein
VTVSTRFTRRSAIRSKHRAANGELLVSRSHVLDVGVGDLRALEPWAVEVLGKVVVSLIPEAAVVHPVAGDDDEETLVRVIFVALQFQNLIGPDRGFPKGLEPCEFLPVPRPQMRKPVRLGRVRWVSECGSEQPRIGGWSEVLVDGASTSRVTLSRSFTLAVLRRGGTSRTVTRNGTSSGNRPGFRSTNSRHKRRRRPRSGGKVRRA